MKNPVKVKTLIDPKDSELAEYLSDGWEIIWQQAVFVPPAVIFFIRLILDLDAPVPFALTKVGKRMIAPSAIVGEETLNTSPRPTYANHDITHSDNQPALESFFRATQKQVSRKVVSHEELFQIVLNQCMTHEIVIADINFKIDTYKWGVDTEFVYFDVEGRTFTTDVGDKYINIEMYPIHNN